MNRLIAYSLAPVFVVAFALSAVEYYSFLQIARLAPPDSVLGGRSAAEKVLAPNEEQENIFVLGAAYQDAAALPLAASEVGYRAARLLYRTALLEQNDEHRIVLFCQALRQLGGSLARDPLNSRLLIHWANVRQLLADTPCREPLTEGDYEAAARFALQRDPLNSEVIFSAAQIFLWAQKTDRAYELLRNFLALSQTVTPRQESFIEAQLTSPYSVGMILPPHFPQIVQWSERIQLKIPTLFSEAQEVLARLQVDAMLQNEVAFKNGEIPSSLYFERLSSLLNVVSSSLVRRKIDGELSRYYGSLGQESLQRYLDQRRLSDTIPVVRAASTADTRPFKSPLIQWEPAEVFTIDNFYSSLGFYLPRESSVDFIELVGSPGSPLISSISFRVLVSDDNRSWEDVSRDTQIQSLEFGSRARVVVGVKGLSKRYWKVHFASSSRDARFSNNPAALIQVYGTVAR